MDLLGTLVIAVGLALDAFAVAVCSGLATPRVRVGQAATMAALFGGFQLAMPVVGWLAGLGLREAIHSWDHWVAFGLLAAVGGKMVFDGCRADSCKPRPDPFRLGTLLLLAMATSIDALAVGLTFSLLAASIVLPVVAIGVVTFGLSFAGVYAGRRFGDVLGGKVEVLGGLLLVAIGVKILVEHLTG
ncbi:MAG: manganese efflux pump [Deltaproteobacteria bacterium]|nr:manganese efflux pump [Deltaproteobacteria bacterium]